MYTYKKVKDLTLSINDRYILSIDNHQEVMEALADFCRKKSITAGYITGLGAVSEATFRFLDPNTLKYVDKTFREQMEITNLTGNISCKDDAPYLHVHLTCSRRDYSCVGGHLLSARINGACELLVEDYSLTTVNRRTDPETGLNLYDF